MINVEGILEQSHKSLTTILHDSQGLSFWKKILDGPVIQLFQCASPVPKVLSAACDVLATISPEMLDSLIVSFYYCCFLTALLCFTALLLSSFRL